MESPSNEEVAAYVLDDLPPQQMATIEQQAHIDPELRERIERFQLWTGKRPARKRSLPLRWLGLAAVAASVLIGLFMAFDSIDGLGARLGWNARSTQKAFVTSTLWTGPDQGLPASKQPGQAITDRDPTRQRLLLLTSSARAQVVVARVSVQGVKLVNESAWIDIKPNVPSVVQLAPPAEGLEGEWFISVFDADRKAEGTPAERLTKVSRVLKARIETAMPGPLQASTRPEQEKLERQLSKEASEALGTPVLVTISHWKVVP